MIRLSSGWSQAHFPLMSFRFRSETRYMGWRKAFHWSTLQSRVHGFRLVYDICFLERTCFLFVENYYPRYVTLYLENVAFRATVRSFQHLTSYISTTSFAVEEHHIPCNILVAFYRNWTHYIETLGCQVFTNKYLQHLPSRVRAVMLSPKLHPENMTICGTRWWCNK